MVLAATQAPPATLSYRDTVLATTEAPTKPQPNTCSVQSLWIARGQPAPERWTPPSPIVENQRLNVDEPAPIVDSAIHNMLWLISGTERYMLWFWS